MSTSSADRALLAASAIVAVVALVARVHDVVAYPAMYDYDASSHAVNVVDLLEGHLPDVRSWGGSHAPLYYVVGAIACALLPESVPMHVTLRLLSVLAWLATALLVWRSLRRGLPDADAAVAAVLLLGVPGVVIVTCMMTNDPLVACLITAAMARLVATPQDARLSVRHVIPTAVLAGLAALTKTTGVAVLAIAAAFYAWRSRRAPARAVGHVVVLGVVSTAIAGPHYARLFASLSGPTYAIIGARAGSQEKVVIERVIGAAAPLQRQFPSLLRLLHASVWGDPVVAYLPRDPGPLGTALLAAGVAVTALAALGFGRALVRRDLARRFGVALAFAPLYAAALGPVIRLSPHLVLTKTNYLLPLALPTAIAVAAGLGAFDERLRTGLRAAVVLVAAAGVGLTWYGWWNPTAPTGDRGTPALADAAPARIVQRYFEERASDPIRALTRLAPEQQLAHELRLVRILRIPFAPERDLSPEAERRLELARARTAWLELYNLVRWMQPIAAVLDVTILDVRETDAGAEVRARVAARGASLPPGVPGMGAWPFRPFEQALTLARAGATWRITQVRQDGVADDNAVAAFVADPTLAGLDHLRALGWKPNWEDAIATAVRATS